MIEITLDHDGQVILSIIDRTSPYSKIDIFGNIIMEMDMDSQPT